MRGAEGEISRTEVPASWRTLDTSLRKNEQLGGKRKSVHGGRDNSDPFQSTVIVFQYAFVQEFCRLGQVSRVDVPLRKG